ncbi:MAG: nucleoside recognition domain-containing protein, partial [Christensenellales bacterium]
FVMSFGCSTTAMMLAKNQDNKKLKVKTMLLSQFMSCSAKLPVFTLLCSAFFTDNILMIFALYLIGILVAMIVAIIFQNSNLKTDEVNFVIEMPSYCLPEYKKILKVAFKNGKDFLFRIGGVVLLFMCIVWLLENFNYKLQFVENYNESLLFSLGSLIAPIFTPLGFGNFGVASALIVGLVAKEIIVSTISMLNHAVGSQNGLITSLALPTRLVCFTDASALSFMVFVLLYCPCISSMSLIKKEIGIRYLLIAILIQFSFAYIVSFIVYTFASVLNSAGIVIMLTLCLLTLIIAFCLKSNNNPCLNCNKKCNGKCCLK